MTRAPRLQDVLSYPPRMMNADRSAAYVDLSKTKFMEGVHGGTWPAPKNVDGVPRWDRQELDAAVDALDRREKKAKASGRRSVDDVLDSEDGERGSGLHQ